jgi:branched-chain amino acid transport system substrate-binding protein
MPDRTITRRNALTAAGATATGGVLAACSSSIKGTSSTTTRELKIGWLHPLTGSEASFGSADTFVLSKIRATPQYSNGFSIGGKTWKVTVISYDSQSSPTVAGDLAHQAINSDGVDMLVASSTPETVTPVANAGEALGVRPRRQSREPGIQAEVRRRLLLRRRAPGRGLHRDVEAVQHQQDRGRRFPQ